ncbi:hypothetical protein B9Z65_5893 [Elsinoe australis]|uniref:Uncharacterized protein n=1 Tax=Elsinoe australis TaxID=40998 RepID=A0A2P7YJC0_9PEZI|nr:hypothetical protein B9Z65_5893 [Elsinoe australis]
MQASGLTPLSVRGFFEYVEIVKALLASWLSIDGDLTPFDTTSFDEHLTWWLYYQSRGDTRCCHALTTAIILRRKDDKRAEYLNTESYVSPLGRSSDSEAQTNFLNETLTMKSLPLLPDAFEDSVDRSTAKSMLEILDQGVHVHTERTRTGMAAAPALLDRLKTIEAPFRMRVWAESLLDDFDRPEESETCLERLDMTFVKGNMECDEKWYCELAARKLRPDFETISFWPSIQDNMQGHSSIPEYAIVMCRYCDVLGMSTLHLFAFRRRLQTLVGRGCRRFIVPCFSLTLQHLNDFEDKVSSNYRVIYLEGSDVRRSLGYNADDMMDQEGKIRWEYGNQDGDERFEQLAERRRRVQGARLRHWTSGICHPIRFAIGSINSS